MFATTEKKQRNQRQDAFSSSHYPDLIGWVLIILSLALMFALISYHPNDPSLFSATTQTYARNYLGRFGAHLSALFFQLLGFATLLFPLAGLVVATQTLRRHWSHQWLAGLFSWSVWLFALCTFLGGFETYSFRQGIVKPGGFLGEWLWTSLVVWLNPLGMYLFLLLISGIAFLVLTRLKVATIVHFFAHRLRTGLQRLALLFEHWAQQRRLKAQEREHHRVLAKVSQKEQRTPREVVPRVVPKTVSPSVEPLETSGVETPSPKSSESVAPRDIPITQRGRISEKPSPLVEPSLPLDQGPGKSWIFPRSDFFSSTPPDNDIDHEELKEKAHRLETKLNEFNVTGTMKRISPGPVVTTYEFKPDPGIKYSKILNLSDDLCLALGAESVRIDRIPGRYSIGFEVPNDKKQIISFREMVLDPLFVKASSRLFLALGKTIEGEPYFSDLAKMPHLLIAGQTGSGKSVGLNAMLCSILMKATPDEVKFILIDPKMVEMSTYAEMPHLLTPVVNDALEAANALKWAVMEMERRYKLLSRYLHRGLDAFNEALSNQEVALEEEDEGLRPLPKIVVIIDELADLMMVARGEVEESIARLAQKSRAVGIHLILATQRPSVDIITGVIKSNLPSRLSYRVAQRNDSRIILDANGAEKLLGRGDALFLPPGSARLHRIHAPFLSEKEILSLVTHLKKQGKPSYNQEVTQEREDGLPGATDAFGQGGAASDDLYEKAARLVVRSGQASVSYVQRKLSVGYARAAKLIDLMEQDGIVGPHQGSKAREILVSADYFDGVDSQIR
jgi:S-DNA-T family DNA segregation ATPase FtsK/SpoIIIE